LLGAGKIACNLPEVQFLQISKFYLNKKGSGARKDFSIKINAIEKVT
jgi:hypothetical protein